VSVAAARPDAQFRYLRLPHYPKPEEWRTTDRRWLNAGVHRVHERTELDLVRADDDGAAIGGRIGGAAVYRHGETILGNLAGAGVIFIAGLVVMSREYFELDQLTQACLGEGIVCCPNPSAFVRYGFYSCIALLEVFALFALSLVMGRWFRNRRYAPESR